MAATETVDVTMPQMGVSVSEGTITKWLKQVGEAVEADEPLLEISTDKVDTEVPSPGSGVLQEIFVQEGETVEVGVKLATIGPEGGGAAAPTEEQAEEQEHAREAPPEPATQAAADASMAAASEGVGDVAPSSPGAESAPAEPAPAEPAAAAPSGNGKTFVSPVVARIASEHGVDPQQVPGTGRGGRVTKKDILGFIESGGDAAAAAPAEAPAQPEPAQPEPAQPEPAQPAQAQPEQPAEPPQPRPAQPQAVQEKPKAAPAPAAQAEPEPGELEEPMTAMRRGIAEHMRRSLDTSAHVTSAIEVDMTRVVAIRGKLKREYQEAYGVNPTYLSFVARAAVETLKDYLWINGEIRGDKIVTRNYVNLGFAVELTDGKGLIVPVLKHCEGLNLLGIARGVADVAQRARDKKLLPDEVQGGTFTITNPGGYGTFHGTPVISQPQAGILGTYALVKRPWVVQDEHGQDVIAIRPIMNITLTYDHRLVDGALAGRFLRDLRQRLESWGESDY
jgi:pyruvate dehydrogenase E2 component (dihydrolipoamide acetyltransferase)